MDKNRKPDFIVAGVMKCGTTAAAKDLSRHPQIWMCRYEHKAAIGENLSCGHEMNFWSRDDLYRKGLPWYEQFFEQAPAGSIVGDQSPRIVGRRRSGRIPLKRLVEHRPYVKLIVLFRNPVERAYSHWYFRTVRMKNGPFVSFEDVVRSPGKHARLWEMLTIPARYAEQVSALRDLNLDSRFFIMERQENSRREEYTSMCDFVGADPAVFPEYTGRELQNATFRRERKPMPDDVRNKLRKTFRRQVDSLRKQLNDDIPEWSGDFE